MAAVIIYSLLLLIFYRLTISASKKQLGKVLAIYLLFLCIIAFFFIPSTEADLYRLEIATLHYVSLPWTSFMSLVSASSTPVALIYMRIIGETGLINLLPTLTVFITFANLFYIIRDYVVKKNKLEMNPGMTLLFLMTSGIYIMTIGGIRNILAFSIIMRCFYNESFNNRKFIKNIHWYLIASLIHPAALFMSLLRILLAAFEQQIRLSLKLVGSVLFLAVMWLFYKYVGAFYIDAMTSKSIDYISSNNYSYIWDQLIALLSLIVVAILLWHYKHFIKNDKSRNNGLDKTYRFSWVIAVISTIFFFQHSIFFRFTMANIMLSIPITLEVSRTIKFQRHTRAYVAIYSAIIMMWLISVTRGSLSSLKLFIF